MKFSITREVFLKPLQQIIGAVERRQTMPVLGNILLATDASGLTLTSTDLELELVAHLNTPIDAPGEITVPARKLLDICRSLPENAEFHFELKEGKAHLRTAKSRFSLATLPATDFPSLEEIKNSYSVSLPQSALRSAIERTAFAMAQQDVRYYLNGLMFELSSDGLCAVATDGHRLALCANPLELARQEPIQVIVPRKGIMELARLLEDSDTPVEVHLTSNHIRVLLPELRFTSKLIDGRFPDYQRVIPQGGNKTLIVERESIRQALTRTAILSNEKYKGIRLVLGGEELKIQTHNPDQEEAEEELAVEYQGEALEVGFNVAYLLDALNAIRSDRVCLTFKDANSSCLIEDPDNKNCKYVVMPMRL